MDGAASLSASASAAAAAAAATLSSSSASSSAASASSSSAAESSSAAASSSSATAASSAAAAASSASASASFALSSSSSLVFASSSSSSVAAPRFGPLTLEPELLAAYDEACEHAAGFDAAGPREGSRKTIDETMAEAGRYLLSKGCTPPSDEQLAVVRALAEGKHATVNAVAGSGKTTTALFLGAYLRAQGEGRKALLLTYNAQLKAETRARVTQLELEAHVEAHSFNAAGYKYFGDACARDGGLREVVLGDAAAGNVFRGCIKRGVPRWDFVIVDEAQDVDRLRHAFTARLVAASLLANKSALPPQFLVIGDERQAIYDYRGADVRFLTCADRGGVWTSPDDRRQWARLQLSTSYRITPSMARFVSEIMLQKPGYIRSSHEEGATRVPRPRHAQSFPPPPRRSLPPVAAPFLGLTRKSCTWRKIISPWRRSWPAISPQRSRKAR